MRIEVREISELEKEMRTLFDPSWYKVPDPYVWTAEMAREHFKLGAIPWSSTEYNNGMSVLGGRIRTFILNNLAAALIDPSPYVRAWAEYLGKT